jgi:drug/metabolite transporter (DMT)-like permease
MLARVAPAERIWAPLVLLSLAISFGAIPLIVRDVALSSAQLTSARIWLSALFMFTVLAWQRRLALPGSSRGRIAAGGILLPLHWFTFFEAIETTRVLVALVLVWAASPAITVLAIRFLGERLSLLTFVAVLGGFGGAALAVDPGNGATAEGVTWALISGLLLAILLLVVKQAVLDLGGLRFGAWQALVASLVTLPWAVTAVADIQAREIPLVLALGLALTGVTGLIWLSTMHRVPMSQLGSIMYMEPMAAVVAAFFVLDEDPGWRGWIGVVLVIAFGILVTWSNRRATQITAPAALTA